MACIIKELLKLESEALKRFPDKKDAIAKVVEQLKYVQGTASSEKITMIDGTALNPNIPIVKGTEVVDFVYKGKEFGTLRSAIDSWLGFASKNNPLRTKVNVVNEMKEIVSTYLEANPDAKKEFNQSGKYFVAEDTKWKHGSYFEDALNSLRYDSLAINGRDDVMMMDGKSSNEAKPFSKFSKVVIKGKKVAIGTGENVTDEQYMRKWMAYMIQNPGQYKTLYDKVKRDKILLVDPYAKTGIMNPAEVIQRMIDKNWLPDSLKEKDKQVKNDVDTLQEGC